MCVRDPAELVLFCSDDGSRRHGCRERYELCAKSLHSSSYACNAVGVRGHKDAAFLSAHLLVSYRDGRASAVVHRTE
jgi:hypothetical protein